MRRLQKQGADTPHKRCYRSMYLPNRATWPKESNSFTMCDQFYPVRSAIRRTGNDLPEAICNSLFHDLRLSIAMRRLLLAIDWRDRPDDCYIYVTNLLA